MFDVLQKRRPRYVYAFGAGEADGHRGMKSLLGGKGAGLAEMSRLGLPVPPGFTLTTEVCALFHRTRGLPREVHVELAEALGELERRAGKRLGDPADPLLVSVRSGAEFSMPGMMDTILNLGLNDQTVEGLANKTGNRRFALDSYRRFILMFGNIALGIDRAAFDVPFEKIKRRHRFATDVEVTEAVLAREVIPAFQEAFASHAGRPFPQDVAEQLALARDAVFRSWNNERAVEYRRRFHIPEHLGTAVNVQQMVFGNRGDTSATGVGFTRDPAVGEKQFFGEFLPNAQGEDVVAGIRTPLPIARMEEWMPAVHQRLRELTAQLERHYRWPQDFEFTVEEGRLYLLQTRNAKCTAFAAVRWVSDLLDEGLLDEQEALLQVDPGALDQLLHPVFDPKARQAHRPVAKGLAAGPGAACGRVVFEAKEAVARARVGETCVLVRQETCPDDVHGMIASAGILTATGGMTSHAAVVGRQLGKPCVVGCEEVQIDARRRTLRAGGKVVSEGDWISIDGSTGEVRFAQVPTVDSEILRVLAGELRAGDSRGFYYYNRLMRLCDRVRRLKVRANADQPADAERALQLGAEGIGLCRTEHMFFAPKRLPHVVALILAARGAREGLSQLAPLEREFSRSGGEVKTLQGGPRALAQQVRQVRKAHGADIRAYRRALEVLLRYQREDFAALFRTMRGHPVTVRTLDPPLHEFLPSRDELKDGLRLLSAGGRVAGAKGRELASLLARVGAPRGTPKQRREHLARVLGTVETLHEFNPMLGHRGCRLGNTFPEITQMQGRALFEAAADCLQEKIPVRLEIMVPLVGVAAELARQKAILDEVAAEVRSARRVALEYSVGVMIEVPRAAVAAGELAQAAEFFSFGTNDLTQLTFGYSRDDAGKFIHHYLADRILPRDPFVTLDTGGVGELMRWAVKKGTAVRPDLKLGICGEHGGDPASIAFCEGLNLAYVSCSPYRVPVARLAAAQAVLRAKRQADPAAGPRTTKEISLGEEG